MRRRDRHQAGLLSWIAACWRGEAGGVGIVFGISGAVLIGIAGLSIDYARAYRIKLRLLAAADAAALAAVRAAIEAEDAASLAAEGGGSDDNDQAPPSRGSAREAGQQQGEALWLANVTKIVDANSVGHSLSVRKQGDTWTSQITFTAEVTTSLAGVLGIAKVPVGGDAAATTRATSPTYMEFHMLLDTSQSMGLAATKVGMNDMLAAVGCQFGCHVTGESAYYDYAKANGIDMRIDVLRRATQTLVDEAKAVAVRNDQFSFALHTFDIGVNTLQPLTDRLDDVRSSAGLVDLPVVYDATYVDAAIDQVGATIEASDDGSTKSKPKRFLFIVTDGVQDGYYTGWRPPSGLTTGIAGLTSAISPTACDSVKAKGVTVAVLYTHYEPFPGQWQYDDIVRPFEGDIAPNLKACASEGYFFEASEARDIEIAMDQMFKKSVAGARNVRLTQ